MTNPFDQSRYEPLPEHSPYTRHDRYDKPPKEVFKAVEQKLRQVADPDRPLRYADIACANGEMLYYLRSQFPRWDMSGYDITPEFIETGRQFAGLDGVALHVSDLFDIEARFDVVTCVNIMSLMWDPQPVLEKLLSLVAPGGTLVVEGLFNEHDVEVRMVMMDNSTSESEGRWFREGNQHSQASIAKLLDGQCEQFSFDPVVMGVEIPPREGVPATHVWTFKDEHGRNLVTNGSHVLFQNWLLTVQTSA